MDKNDENSYTCPNCGHVFDDAPETGNIKDLSYTQYVHWGNMYYLREGLPDNHPASVPSLYFDKYGEKLPKDWREVFQTKDEIPDEFKEDIPEPTFSEDEKIPESFKK